MKPGTKALSAASPGTSIVWQEIHRRLEATREAIALGRASSPEATRKTLVSRARALALETSPLHEQHGAFEVIEFVLAHERYAIESIHVREVYPLKDLTSLPCTPAYVLGIINLRGQILPVIDIKRFFDLPPKGLGDLNKVIILRSDLMEFGILADQIVGTRMVGKAELQPSLPTLTGIREDYLKGVTVDRLVVLDAAKLLSDKRIVVDERAHTNN